MTGGGFALPSGGDSDDDSDLYSNDGGSNDVRLEMTAIGAAGIEGRAGSRRRSVEWVGKPYVVGPKWMKMPLLTVGMLGLQCVWSIEMGYASPYLLELGLSKSLMSLVFVAGPLSGLVMQPLIGVLADRSKSRFGRRRPFMLTGCAVSVFAMMLLGWAREVAAFLGGEKLLAIWLAVFSIYLIDFSINAVQATDRALVVDILPPSQQEAGNAWAGRMFGFGSLAGFYVGNINLVNILPFLGNTQLQVLSFLTSMILMSTHGLTAYSTKERVLLRDNRRSSQNGFMDNVKSIWTGFLTLPHSIKMICYTQFFAWIGWFPILFYTSVWVGEIYTREQLVLGRSEDDPELSQDANRAGSRALFFNAVVNLLTSILLPFMVSASGIQGSEALDPSPTANRESTGRGDSALSRLTDRFGDQLDQIRIWTRVPAKIRLQLPIPGFTLIRAWIIGQAMFTLTMFATIFAHSTRTASFVIALNGFCWAIAQWAPFSLLGELILQDTKPVRGKHMALPTIMADSHGMTPRTATALAESEEEEALIGDGRDGPQGPPKHISSRSRDHSGTTTTALPVGSTSRNRTPMGSRKTSREGSPVMSGDAFDSIHEALETMPLSKSPLRRSSSVGSAEEISAMDEVRLSLAEEDQSTRDRYGFAGENGVGLAVEAPQKPRRENGNSTAEKAGVILGIHNIFIVIPQFLVTLLSSIIFYLLEPTRDGIPDTHHTGTVIPINANATLLDPEQDLIGGEAEAVHLLARELEAHVTGGSDSVGLIFRMGGVSAAVAGYMCWRLSRDWARQNA